MTKARILADYVAGGTTAAEFDYMDGVTSNVQTQLTAKAPLASPAFTGTPTGITAAHLEAGVLPSDVTGGSGLTALGTVATGNLSNSAIVYPVGHVIQVVKYSGTGTSPTTTTNDSWVTVAGGTFTPSITITAGNKIAFLGSYMLGAWNGGVDVGANLRIIDTTNNNTIVNSNGDSNYIYLSVQSSSGNETDAAIPINTLYTPSSGTTINFSTQFRANWYGTIQINVPMSSVVMMEIQA